MNEATHMTYNDSIPLYCYILVTTKLCLFIYFNLKRWHHVFSTCDAGLEARTLVQRSVMCCAAMAHSYITRVVHMIIIIIVVWLLCQWRDHIAYYCLVDENMHGDGTDECFTSIVPYGTAEKKTIC